MSISEPKRHRAPRRRKRAGARTLGATPYRDPFAAGVSLTENPNRGKRHGASVTTRTRGGLTPNESARIADGRKRHEPLTVITPIVRDRAGRALPANRRSSSSYTI